MSQGRNGWEIASVAWLKTEPMSQEDLLRERRNVTGTTVPNRLFNTRGEALAVLLDELFEFRATARAKIQALSEPEQGKKDRNRPHYLEDARRELSIAEAGIRLLNLSAAEIAARELEQEDGFRLVRRR
jgi:hypothetical protein